MYNAKQTADELRKNAQLTRSIADWIAKKLGKLNLSDSVTVNGYVGSVWIYVSKREDFTQLLTTAPGLWKKTAGGDTLDYEAEISVANPKGYRFKVRIRAKEEALPPTCRVIEEWVDVPEHLEPARREKRRRVVCDPAPASSAEAQQAPANE